MYLEGRPKNPYRPRRIRGMAVGSMIKSYLVEVKQETIIHVSVDAENEQEAVERVLRHEGDPGDSIPRDPIILSARCLND